MTYEELLENAKPKMGNYCKACPVCNGRACKNQMPGPGAKGVGDTAIRNYEKWQDIRVQMDTLCMNKEVDTKWKIFGKTFAYPFLAGPAGAVNLHYGESYNDTAEVQEEIADAVKGRMKVFVDGGIRSGVDVFKALALGADGVIICRPFVTAVYGGGADGVRLYIEKNRF